ncbi:MAG: acyl-CoA/acyl-ACP dehydrogenase [Acidimicrobiales bacterium]|nr:acyl-CoA/acyl-ACP dehydrogenase [Acidimicrobiales bacterium]
MDFTPTVEQEAVTSLADQIFGDALSPELQSQRLRVIESGDDWFDDDLWRLLADAGLLGITLSTDIGGAGLDAVALALLVRTQGAHVAPLPLLPSSVAAFVVDHHGSPAQRERLLPGIVDGSQVLTVGVQELLDDRLNMPTCIFAHGQVTGTKVVVEHFEVANRLLVTASSPSGPCCVLVDKSASGISVTSGRSTRLQPLSQVTFKNTPGELVGDSSAVQALLAHLRLAICATQLGVTEQALALTAEYATNRQQFGRPIATFQAVGQRLADQFVNVGGIRLATLSAAWRLANNLDAEEDLLVAKWWASERATEVAHATQHIHGGMGMATDYPLHRYTLWNKHLTTSLGAGNQTLRHLGALLAN